MHKGFTVDMCIDIRKGCPITYVITGEDQAEFSFGGQRSGCHYAFDAAALEVFLKVGAEALAELENEAADATATPERAIVERRSA